MTCSIKTRMRITLDLYFFHFCDWPVDFMASKAGSGAASIAAAATDRPELLRRVKPRPVGSLRPSATLSGARPAGSTLQTRQPRPQTLIPGRR